MAQDELPAIKRAPKSPTLNTLIKQLEDPRSLISFLPEFFQNTLTHIHEDLLDLDEAELLTQLKKDFDWEPTVAVEALRSNFWAEYDRVQFSKIEKFMVMENIYLGVLTKQGFYQMLDSKPFIGAYLVSRPLEYEVTMQSMQHQANRRIFEFLKMNHGRDPKIMDIILKTIAMVDLRNRGGYINRSETKNLTVINQKTEHSHSHALAVTGEGKTIAQLELEIKEKLLKLEEDARRQLPPPMPKFEKTEVAIQAEYKDVTDGERKP